LPGGGIIDNSKPVSAFAVQPSAAALPLITAAPRVSAAAADLLKEVLVVDERGARRSIFVPVERPLTVFIDGRELLTLMTIGGAPELLVLGFLLNQRMIDEAASVASIAVDWESNRAAVHTRERQGHGTHTTERGAVTACGLGSVYDDLMRGIGDKELPSAREARMAESTLLAILDVMSHQDDIHRSAGSVHGCALFRGSELWVSVEDVGRHNAIDSIAGWMALRGLAGSDKILFTTGRLTGEMVIKAAQMGVPIVVSRNGVSALGLELAVKLGMTLFGRATGRRFLCYAGGERFDALPPAGPLPPAGQT
jgi:FdhD protein